jgi:hypothetical protein
MVAVNWRNIAIALTDSDFGEQKAQSGENLLGLYRQCSAKRLLGSAQKPA